MDEKQLRALANELAKNLKTPEVKWSTKTGHRVRVFPVSVF
ncbi:transposase [Escherichia coli]|nr:transposase [Escherichia coli]